MAASDRKDRDRDTMERIGRSMGGLAGRAADAAAEMGTAMVKGAADVLGGWWGRSGAREAVRAWSETDEQRSREHFEATLEASGGDRSASAGAEVEAEARSDGTPVADRPSGSPSYDQIRPYYQLGHAARHNPEYEARKFEEVEPELRRVAESAGGEADRESNGEGRGINWPDVRGYVEFGYEQDEGERSR